MGMHCKSWISVWSFFTFLQNFIIILHFCEELSSSFVNLLCYYGVTMTMLLLLFILGLKLISLTMSNMLDLFPNQMQEKGSDWFDAAELYAANMAE